LFIRKANALGTKSLTKTCNSKVKISTASSDVKSLKENNQKLKYKKIAGTKQSKILNSILLMSHDESMIDNKRPVYKLVISEKAELK